jgi:3D (Asp-Asp-Asp) domain-containing protein
MKIFMQNILISVLVFIAIEGMIKWHTLNIENQYLKEIRGLQEEQINLQKEKIQILEKKLSVTPSLHVKLTAYTPRKEECDDDPLITASMKKVRSGGIAVSRDLYKLGWTFGKFVKIEGHGIFEITDLMNSKHKKSIDVFMWDLKKANKFGIKYRSVTLLG